MTQSTRKMLMGVVAVLFVGVIFTQMMLDPGIREIHKGERTALQGLSNEFILGPMLGLQEAVAGALWVRADEFFHEGDYDAILPIVRMVTWLDPHQLDVYITGAWHLAYNFTDSSERSDRRYIPAAQKLLEEGDKNNSNVYDIAFELGWQNIDKIKDYERAEHWFRIARERKAASEHGEKPKDAPMFVWHMLAHALEREGRIEDACNLWRECLAKSEVQVKAKPDDFSVRSTHESELHNLKLDLERNFSRYKSQVDFDLDAKLTKNVNMQTGEPEPRDAYLALDAKIDGVPVGTPRLPAVARPWNTAFETAENGRTMFKFTESKVLDVKGKVNIGDGARITIKLQDDNYREKTQQTFTFDIDQSQTIMLDQHSVRGALWGRKIDMSKDPKMYSFSRPYYYLIFEFNPRGTSPFIQDRIGWSGEGMTDPKYLWVQKATNPKEKDIRMLRKVYKLSRAQIMASEPITEASVISNEEFAKVQSQIPATKEAPAQQ
jgi:hypothetical protein